ncbi:MAG TPA: ABC transporter permease [Dehalococcoidales bacterium]|nr:ABC transporter permease [Dehalococcoidales bacterium]
MITYIIRRLLLAVVILFLVTVMVFFGMRLLPGDPILLLVTSVEAEGLSIEAYEKLRKEHGLDRPMVVQYIDWLGGVVQGDLGNSILRRTPVIDEIMQRIPITLHLGATAYIIGLLVGIPAGTICAVRRGKLIDTIITVLANIGITVPVFWLGIMLIYLFSLELGWLPVQGYTSPFVDFWRSTKQIILPVFCMSVWGVASLTRQTRSSMLEVMNQDYIRTARAKGLTESMIIIKHAMKNGLIPILTLAGMGLAMIIAGSVIIEMVFNIPGIGRLLIGSIINKDYPYVEAIVLIIAATVLLINLLVDLAYGWLDPRIRYG